ncbi:hypothetical protein GKZ89_16850 [Bacillus mangrovi]|uniref:Lipoprotein YvcA n=1 Tax=Metabacillus mangrovi TaxID=1491830 RepID=A0A7X2S881_9BACI|nr:hypothetical protein [Metabacillus mangrovi]MTH55075.1 hypothetical protein [Metabacillus mangrovi]
MKRLIKVGIILNLIMTVGCGMSKTPDERTVQGRTAAEKDSFTKGYLSSSKETEDGYHLFKSKTGGYTMLFPDDAVLSKEFNEQREASFESIVYGAERKNASIMADATYENKPETQDAEANLELLSNTTGYTGEYEERKEEGRRIYYASEESEIEGAMSYNYFGFIQSAGSSQAVEFIYNVSCEKAAQACRAAEADHEKTAMKIMKSVTFSKE